MTPTRCLFLVIACLLLTVNLRLSLITLISDLEPHYTRFILQSDEGVSSYAFPRQFPASTPNGAYLGNRTSKPWLLPIVDKVGLELEANMEMHGVKNGKARNRELSLPLCRRDQIKHGSWGPVQVERPPYVTFTKHLRCYPSEYYKLSPYNTWEWKQDDDSCRFLQWNAELFCNLTAYGQISIIGDSLSWEMYSSLLQLLGARVRQKSQHESKELDKNHIQTSCGSNTKFVWRNDSRLRKVGLSISEDFPTILILNRGAHYVSDDILLDDIRRVIQEVQNWQGECDKRKIRCHFFWRTTVPGHPGCENFTRPVNSISEMENLINDVRLYNNVSMEYHWYDFKHQNQLVEHVLNEAKLQLDVIDAYHINILRPDEHRVHQGDCLHNCYPGKMDVYNRLLLHFLYMHASWEAVGRSSG